MNVDITSVQPSEMKHNGLYRRIRDDSFDLFEFNGKPAYRKENTNLYLRFNATYGQWEIHDIDLGTSKIYFKDPLILCPEAIGSNWTTLDEEGKKTKYSQMTITCG